MFQAAFLTESSFSDHENYPDGFCKSNVFTLEQAVLLKSTAMLIVPLQQVNAYLSCPLRNSL